MKLLLGAVSYSDQTTSKMIAWLIMIVMTYLFCIDCVIVANLKNQCNLVVMVEILVVYFQFFFNLPLIK